MTALIHAIEHSLARRGAAPALFWQDRVLSFAELDATSLRLAHALLARGIAPADRIAVSLENSPELIVTVLATLRCGAVLVPLNPAATPCELAYLLSDCGAALVITEPQRAAAIRGCGYAGPLLCELVPDSAAQTALPRRVADDPALLMYTSGTTSQPKGAVLSHGALHSNFDAVAKLWEWTASDRLLLTLPCFHLHGLGLGILLSLQVGSSIVLRPRFVVEEALALLTRYQCTMFFGVPTMYGRLVQLSAEALAGAELQRMRLWVSGSALMPASVYERFHARFGRVLMNRYGLTEACCVLSTRCRDAARAGNVGRPLPGVDVRLVDEERLDDAGELHEVGEGEPGELLVRSSGLFSGYWQRPAETQRALVAGFLRTGDIAVREADGSFRMMGRRSLDIIKSRGFKISALEIESCLQSHEAVAAVAVVGLPHAERGEAVVAAVTLLAGAAVSAQELRQYAGAHLAPHKVPMQVVFLDELPRVGPGKFKKAELIKQLSSLSSDERDP